MNQHPAEGMEELDELAGFLPDLERPDFKAGEVHGGDEIEPGVFTMPYVAQSPVVDRFVEAAYRDGWVLTDFDWPQWAQSEEAQSLRDDDAALADATPEQLCRLLTVCIRQDRFSEGALLAAFESGLIMRIVRRAAVLAAL